MKNVRVDPWAIKRYMDYKKFNQTEIGRRLGLSQQAISRRFCNQTAWSADELTSLAEILEVPLNRLLQ